MRRTIRLELSSLEAPRETPVLEPPGIVEAPDAEEIVEDAPPGGSSNGFRVILYNDDHHSFDEVIEQLHKATSYSLLKCEAIAIEAHRKGRAICYRGTREKCHTVTRVLREIRLQCEVDCD